MHSARQNVAQLMPEARCKVYFGEMSSGSSHLVYVCVCACVLCLLVRGQRARTHKDIHIALQDASTQLFEASSCVLFVTEGVFVVTPICT